MERLEFKQRNVFSKSFARDNLSYVVRHTHEKMAELVHILQRVPGTAIVYVRSRKRTKVISDHLNLNGIKADYYHAGLSIEEKEDKQNKWKTDECRVVVATNAFGMGIDKPDVRVVVHVDVPNSLEEYYQEAGRAGRDGKHSYVVLLVSSTDSRTLHRHVTDSFPEKDFLRTVYERACNFMHVAVGCGYDHQYDFNFNLFCRTFNLPVLPTHSALNILTRAGYISFIEEVEAQSRVMILADKNELYELHTTTPCADQVLQALLRIYTGLFADYVFINEDVIAYRTGIDQETIYNSLLEFTRMHILHYVPRKRTPFIYFPTSREEPRYLRFPKAVYEDLRQRMQERVEAVLSYASTGVRCREAALLAYFGELNHGDCGHCDACIERKKQSSHTSTDVQEGVLYMTQVKPRTMQELIDTLSFSRDEICDMVSFLVDEGYILHLPDDTYSNPEPLK